MLEQRAYGWFHYYRNHSHLSNSSAALRDGTAKLVLDRVPTPRNNCVGNSFHFTAVFVGPFMASNVYSMARFRWPRGRNTGWQRVSSQAICHCLCCSLTGPWLLVMTVPYLRDTRRSIGLDGFRLQYESLANAGNRSTRHGVQFADTVAIGSYAHDTHGLSTCKIPSYVTAAPPAKPYYIPFRALTSDGADNLLVAGKTMAASFSANSATRLHPEEWSTGVAAGAAAALLVTNAQLNTTRQLLEQGMPALLKLLGSPPISQPLSWNRPAPTPPGPLTWRCEIGRKYTSNLPLLVIYICFLTGCL